MLKPTVVTASKFILTSGEAVLFAALLAGILAIIGAVVGGFYGFRREHKQWLRDARRKSYETLLAVGTRFQMMEANAEDMAKRRMLYAELYAAVSAVLVAGPKTVADAAVEYKNAVSGSDHAAMTKAEGNFVSLVRETLGSD
jgi:uncharacterized iron-regulated membrane protein